MIRRTNGTNAVTEIPMELTYSFLDPAPANTSQPQSYKYQTGPDKWLGKICGAPQSNILGSPSFLPDLKGGPGALKLLMASPRAAIKLCKKLKKSGRRSTKICNGKPGYEITVDDFLKNSGNLLKLNLTVQAILDKIRRNIIRKKFNLPYVKSKPNIIGIPVLFNGIRMGKGKAKDAVARTAGMVNCLVVKPYVIVPKPCATTQDHPSPALKSRMMFLALVKRRE